ncbi:hypothetical protein D3C75_1189580 [compost metagenome]
MPVPWSISSTPAGNVAARPTQLLKRRPHVDQFAGRPAGHRALRTVAGGISGPVRAALRDAAAQDEREPFLEG